MAELFRYAAFISYSSKDRAFTRRLHRALESYRIPSSLGTFDLIGNGKSNRIYPVFRDREELPTGHLDDLIKASLAASATLVVVCSPDAAQSHWVQREIEYFTSLGRADRIHLIVPSTASEAAPTMELFPPVLRGSLSLVAADARRSKDGYRNAWLKLIAGLVGVTPGQLIDRDRKRQARRRLASAGALMGLITLAAAAAIIVDTRNARSDMTNRADQLTSEGLPLEAMPFAIAGLPAAGDVVSVSHPGAEVTLRATGGGVRMFAELVGYQVGVSNDGRFIVSIAENGGEMQLITAGTGEPRANLGSGTEAIFSPDSRLLAIANADREAQLRWLGNEHAPISLGQVAPNQGLKFSSDSRHLIVTDDGGSTVLWTVGGAPTRRPLGLVSADFSPDGRYLLSFDAAGFGYLRDLNTPAAAIEIGPLAREGDVYAFSSDSRFLIVRDAFGSAEAIDIRQPNHQTFLGRVNRFDLAADAPVLATSDAGAGTSVRDLRDGSAPREVGQIYFTTLSGDGRFLIGVDGDQSSDARRRFGIVFDLTTGRRQSLGELELSPQFAVSNDGRYLAYRNASQEGLLRDLRAGTDEALGLVSQGGYGFSPDSRFLVIHSESYFASLKALDGASETPLGPIDAFEFSENGRFLFTWPMEEERTIVRDLDAFAVRRGAVPFRAEVCALNAEAMRPFRQVEREGQEASRHLYQRLRGRPWNPCDWRGLFAFENNWEGLRQWRRLIGVRVFRERDYACGEVNAAGQISPARQEACERPPRRAPELLRPTAHPAL